MKVVIAQVDKVFFDGEARSLTLPASAGEMTVLPSHMPLITTLKAGTIVVRLPVQAGSGEGERRFPIESGILEVRTGGATVIL